MTGDTRHRAGTLFVGRERELAVLRAALAAATGGQGRVVLVSGEPGIGKTRLAEELAHRATAEGATVRWGRCGEGSGAPAFWPWLQILRAQFAATDTADLRAQLGTGAEEIVRLVPDLHERLPGVATVPFADDEGARFRLFDSVASFLRASTTGQPLVLILEDLHWAQPASVDLLRFLIDDMQEARILVIATYRDVEVSEHHPLTAVLQAPSYPPQVQRVALAGLSEEEIRQLIEALGQEASAALAARIHRESGGNPFFAGEIVRGLRAAEARIPSSVRDAVSHRLLRLSEGCHRLLGAASVIGSDFEFATLERIATELGDCRQPLQLLSEAANARIVVEIPEAGGRGYRFAHALIRDVLYAALPLEERLRLHWHVATALEQLGGADRERGASVLAYHFSEAIAGCADGAPRQACVDKAVLYAAKAALQARDMAAYEETTDHYKQALHIVETWTPHDTRRQCELLLDMGESQTRAWAGYAGRRETFWRAAALARQLGEPQFMARAAFGLSARLAVSEISHTSDRHAALLREALVAVGPDDSGVRARLLGNLALVTHYFEPLSHRLALTEEAVAVARRVGDPHALWPVLLSRLTTLTEPGQAEERMAVATEVIHVGEQLGDREVVMYGRGARLMEALEQGQVGTVQRELAEYTRLADDLRQPSFRWWAVAIHATLALLQGRFADAEQLAIDGPQMVQGAVGEYPGVLATSLGQLSVVRWEQDRYGELEDFARAQMQMFPFIPGNRAGLAHVCAEAGRVDEARAEIKRLSSDDLEAMSHIRDGPVSMAVLTQAHVILGDTTHAKMLYELLLPYARQLIVAKDGKICLGSGSHLLGLLAHLMGRWHDALRHLDEALAAHTRINSPPWIADTKWATAKVLLARNGPGDCERAGALLAEVLQTTEQLGMRRLQRLTLALQEQGSGTVDKRTQPLDTAPEQTGPTRGERREAYDNDTEPVTPSSRPPSASYRGEAIFRREGEYWVIRYEAPAFQLKDRMGLRHLALLLSNPGREFLAIDLVAAVQGSADRPVPKDGAQRTALGTPEPYFDEEARRAYTQRLRDLRAALEEAEAFNDIGRASETRAEIELVSDELRRGIGLGGRLRPSGSPVERGRVNVTRAIKAALAAIAEHDAALGHYLAATIKTGAFCSYSPDPRDAVAWEL